MISTRMWVPLILLLLSQLPANSPVLAAETPVRIGFTCCNFYDPNLGTPVFAPGEDLWLMATQNVSAVLHDSNREVISRNIPADSSLRFYSFRADDSPGLWTIDIQGKTGEFLMPIYLTHLQTHASLTSMTYNLTGNELSIKGTLTAETGQEGGTLLLVRNDQSTFIDTNQVAFPGGFLQAHISWNASNPSTLIVTPFASGGSAPNVTSAWAEVSSEIALFQQVGNSRVLTLIPQLVTRTNREPMQITSQPQPLTVELPSLHRVGVNGQAPLRMGPLRLIVYLQTEGVIYSLEADTFLFANGIAASIGGMTDVPPLQNPINFELADDLQRVSGYNLYLIAKESGVGIVWNKTITPPITRLRVVSTLTNETVDDYQIGSDQIQESAKVGSDTFVIPRSPDVNAELNLTVGGIALQSNEFNPNSTKLEPLSTVQIGTQATDTHLLIQDALGNIPSSGTVRLTRISGTIRSQTLPIVWNSSSSPLNLTLPVGDYEADLTTEGSTATSHFSISHPSEYITLSFNGLVLAESRNELILTGIVSVIIVIEVFSIFRLWQHLAKRKKKQSS